jgi:hypothetical protein
MAQLTNEILGDPRGGIAHLMFKIRNGKVYIAKRPAHPNSGSHPNTIYKKNQGKFIGKLSKAIYSNLLIKKIWFQSEFNKQYLYQQIWKENYHSINCIDLSGRITLTPSFGFTLISKLIEQLKNDSGIITAGSIENTGVIDPEIEKMFTAFGIIVYKNNPESSDAETNFGIITADSQVLDLSNPIELSFNINTAGLPPIQIDAVKRISVILITLDQSGNPVRYSETISAG